MKFKVIFLLSLAVSQATEVRTYSGSKQENEDSTERSLKADGHTGLEKRAPFISSVSPSVSPGVEYADSKDSHLDKSPSQTIYATPVPQLSKISDVLSGHNVPFPTAIASHLYSPISIYQPKLGSPTTYEVSPPIASQLAYSEHKVSYQPQQNAIQYFTVPQKPVQQKEPVTRFNLNYNQQPIYLQQQPILYQPQPVQQQPTLYQPQIQQPIFQIPNYYQRSQQQIANQGFGQVQYYPQQAPQQHLYNQQQLPTVQLIQPNQGGIVYARQGLLESQTTHQRPTQRELKNVQTATANILEKQSSQQNQGAVSYASFSQGPAPAYEEVMKNIQPVQLAPKLSPKLPVQRLQPQVVYQIDYQAKQTYQNPQQQQVYENPQTQAYQNQLYQAGKQYFQIPQPQAYQVPQNQIYQIVQQAQPPNYQQLPQNIHTAKIVNQPQRFSVEQEGNSQNQLGHPQELTPVPTFAPVQYFGKFAQNIFGAYQQ